MEAKEIMIYCEEPFGCGWSGPPEKCKPSMSPYHDFQCPKCGTTALDTSELNAAWAKDGNRYGYGDRNFLIEK